MADGSEVDDDLLRDPTEVLTSFCARLYGRRRAQNAHSKLSNPQTETAGPRLPLERTGLTGDETVGDFHHHSSRRIEKTRGRVHLSSRDDKDGNPQLGQRVHIRTDSEMRRVKIESVSDTGHASLH